MTRSGYQDTVRNGHLYIMSEKMFKHVLVLTALFTQVCSHALNALFS